MMIRSIKILLVLLISSYSFAKQNTDLNQKEKFDIYLNAPIEKAKKIMYTFSDDELEVYWNNYLNTKSIEEKRVLWLIEEYYTRKSLKISENRLKYVFLVCITLLALFFILVFLLYKKTHKLEATRGMGDDYTHTLYEKKHIS